MARFICWVCRRKSGQEITGKDPDSWGKCTICGKTREAREPVKPS